MTVQEKSNVIKLFNDTVSKDFGSKSTVKFMSPAYSDGMFSVFETQMYPKNFTVVAEEGTSTEDLVAIIKDLETSTLESNA